MKFFFHFYHIKKRKYFILNSDWQCCYGLTIAVQIRIHVDGTVIGHGDSLLLLIEKCVEAYSHKLVESHNSHHFSSLGNISLGKQDGHILTEILKAALMDKIFK